MDTNKNKMSEENKKELDEIMDANEFMRRQTDLFSAFIWRHEQKHGISSSKQNINDEDNEQISRSEYDQLQRQLPIDLRLKIAVTEKSLIKNEIEDLNNKSDKDLDTLRAVLEECRLRTAEIKKNAYDFRRDIVISSQQNKHSQHNLSEKIKKFICDKLKSKQGTLKKYKSKNQALTQQISKLQEQMKVSSAQSGDSFDVIDLDQLKIQNNLYNQIILERNRELLKLKMNTGKTVQQLNNYKQDLANQSKETKVLSTAIVERESLLKKLEDELNGVGKELNKQNRMFVSNKSKLQNADIPHVIDYVQQKQSQQKIEAKLKSYERKLEIAELSAKRAKKVIMAHTLQQEQQLQMI